MFKSAKQAAKEAAEKEAKEARKQKIAARVAQERENARKFREARLAAKQAKVEKRRVLSNPDRILQYILSESSFKVPNLSDLVTAKFREAQFGYDVDRALDAIVYENTTTNDISTSILPTRFNNYSVNLGPCALTYLPCMYEIPKRRKRHGKNQNGNQSKKHKDNSYATNQNDQQLGNKKVTIKRKSENSSDRRKSTDSSPGTKQSDLRENISRRKRNKFRKKHVLPE